MKFKHTPLRLPYADLTASDEGYGRVYATPSGAKYPSITTCLGILSDGWLKEWRARVGEEEANRIGKRAAIRGKALHEAIESYIANIQPSFGYDLPLQETFEKIADVLDGHVTDILGVEMALYSDVLEVAGRADLICLFDGKVTVVDYKTSKSAKEALDIASYYLQTAFYSLCVEEILGVKVEQCVIIMAADDMPSAVVYKTTPSKWYEALAEITRSYKIKLTNQLVK